MFSDRMADDLEDIKRAVSSKRFYEPIADDPLPHEVIDLNKMIEETPKIAPVFVRVDRYREILSKIQEMKNTIKNLESALIIRKNIHKINAESDEVIEKAIQKFTESTNIFGREFVTPRGAENFARESEKVENVIDSNVAQISDEILRLKEELEKIKL
jgi:hypothetical protein